MSLYATKIIYNSNFHLNTTYIRRSLKLTTPHENGYSTIYSIPSYAMIQYIVYLRFFRLNKSIHKVNTASDLFFKRSDSNVDYC